MKLSRRLPVRVSLAVLATVVVLFNAIVTVAGHAPISDGVVISYIGLITFAIGGDTLRPSGHGGLLGKGDGGPAPGAE